MNNDLERLLDDIRSGKKGKHAWATPSKFKIPKYKKKKKP